MKGIKKLFDDFYLTARIMPAITVVFPLLAMALYRGIFNSEWSDASVGFVLAVVIIMFLANIIREWGKSYEEKMYENLKAMPTTIVMRFSDDKIDEISKVKYHKWFNLMTANYQLPMSLEEENADVQSDIKYTNAMKMLRVYANAHRDMFPRVYQELKKYNYWRNLYGCKKLAIVMYILLIIIQIREMIFNPSPQYGVLIGLILWTVLYCVTVTKAVVNRNAFDYAITLTETICDIDIQ